MSTPPSYLPDSYAVNIMHTLGAAFGVTAFHLILESKSPEEQLQIKENLLHTWLAQWKVNFQNDMNRYNEVLGDTTNGDRLPQPEDFQLGFNKAMAIAEKTARIALRMEEAE